MKTFRLLFLFLLILIGISSVSAQQSRLWPRKDLSNIPLQLVEQMDEMGLDGSPLLTEAEGEYLNALYQIDKKTISLSNKNVMFFTGSSGTMRSDKEDFFSSVRAGHHPIYCVLYLFNAEQKEQLGGFDAAIVYGSKRLFKINQVVRMVRKHHKKENGMR